ncbi:hypothetical protein [Helicobacter saguini]|nr:hypothetical protein [Helicobacter saguini]
MPKEAKLSESKRKKIVQNAMKKMSNELKKPQIKAVFERLKNK